MVPRKLRRLAGIVFFALATSAQAQTDPVPARAVSESAAAEQPELSGAVAQDAGSSTPPAADSPASPERSLSDRIWSVLSQSEDPDGPISTDRPTFTPANTVVPRGRLQFESGFTFNSETSPLMNSSVFDYPELALRYGLATRVEFRMFWLGPTDVTGSSRRRGARVSGGISDMEIGFKWQLLTGDKTRKWKPTTALITSATVPTSTSSAVSSHTAEPVVNLIYGWSLTDKLTLAGSTGYLGLRHRATTPGGQRNISDFQRFHQSLVAFYAVAERTTLFYEWYALMFTNSSDNRPTHFMDGGVLYRLSTNTQLDLRAGFGLSRRPDDFFTGAGFSVRF
jgi:hypothetical protein